MLKHFELDMCYEDCCGFTISEYIEAYGNNRDEQLHEALIHKINKLHKEYDFVVIEGYSRNAFASVFDFDINMEIAKNLNTVLVPVIKAKGKSSSKIVNEVRVMQDMISEDGCTHLATFINRANEDIIENIKKRINAQQIDKQIYILPEVKELNSPTLDQISKLLDAKMIMGSREQLQHIVYGNKIAAMGVENYLSHINNGDIVIVPGDRIDIIIISLLSFYAKNHTKIIGIILSGGVPLSPTIKQLLEDFSETVIPLFTVESDSYKTAIALEKVPANITAESTRKITLAKGLFSAAIDREKLGQRFISSSNTTLTPIMFQYRLFEQAQSKLQKIVLPESEDERILRATEILIRRNIADIILLGDRSTIEKQCMHIDLDISKAEIINPEESPLTEKFAQHFYEMRKEKGLILDVARDAMTHVNYFATMMVQEGLADGMVSGATHTTADTVRPALQIIKTKADISIVSSIFFMCLDTKVLVYGDCAVNMDPTAEELAQIAISSADTAKAFGIEPKVALLSYSTGASGTGPEVEKVREATKLAQAMRPDYLIEGPIQYDAAIDEKVAKKKLPDSKVAGKATVFIFPDLNTGNNTYKAVQRSTGALAIGPVLQGLRLPVNDLSRGCLVDDIVNTVAITAIQAQQGEHK
jgi:phosphate acetyltransferase